MDQRLAGVQQLCLDGGQPLGQQHRVHEQQHAVRALQTGRVRRIVRLHLRHAVQLQAAQAPVEVAGIRVRALLGGRGVRVAGGRRWRGRIAIGIREGAGALVVVDYLVGMRSREKRNIDIDI